MDEEQQARPGSRRVAQGVDEDAQLQHDVLGNPRLVQDVAGRHEDIDEPAGPHRRRHVAQRGTPQRCAPLTPAEVLGELPFLWRGRPAASPVRLHSSPARRGAAPRRAPLRSTSLRLRPARPVARWRLPCRIRRRVRVRFGVRAWMRRPLICLEMQVAGAASHLRDGRDCIFGTALLHPDIPGRARRAAPRSPAEAPRPAWS